jgi:hypothetical protein
MSPLLHSCASIGSFAMQEDGWSSAESTLALPRFYVSRGWTRSLKYTLMSIPL